MTSDLTSLWRKDRSVVLWRVKASPFGLKPSILIRFRSSRKQRINPGVKLPPCLMTRLVGGASLQPAEQQKRASSCTRAHTHARSHAQRSCSHERCGAVTSGSLTPSFLALLLHLLSAVCLAPPPVWLQVQLAVVSPPVTMVTHKRLSRSLRWGPGRAAPLNPVSPSVCQSDAVFCPVLRRCSGSESGREPAARRSAATLRTSQQNLLCEDFSGLKPGAEIDQNHQFIQDSSEQKLHLREKSTAEPEPSASFEAEMLLFYGLNLLEPRIQTLKVQLELKDYGS